MKMRHVDLCSGIGGFALGFQWAELSQPVLFCDVDPWCRRVLAKHWPDVPIATDVKELANDPKRLVPDCDILTAGYPCQPFSLAGKRQGEEDPRHIWPHLLRIVAQKRPTWCVFENVYGHVSLGLDQVLTDLETQGYASRTFIVPACGVNAPHKRDRLWIIAHTDSNGKSNVPVNERERSWKLVADTRCKGLERRERLRQDEKENRERRTCSDGTVTKRSDDSGRQANFWSTEPNVGRVAHGIPRRVDRIRGLGNAIVPQIAQRIGETIKLMEDKQ